MWGNRRRVPGRSHGGAKAAADGAKALGRGPTLLERATGGTGGYRLTALPPFALPPIEHSYVVPPQRGTVVAFLVVERGADSRVGPNVPIDSQENVVRRESRKRVCRIA